jgi:hypothetical protein
MIDFEQLKQIVKGENEVINNNVPQHPTPDLSTISHLAEPICQAETQNFQQQHLNYLDYLDKI